MYDVPSVLNDPQLQARGLWVESNHPPAPPYRRADVLWRMSETPSEFKIPTNNLGEHNREVFCGLLGVPDAEFDQLMADAVIGDEYRPGAEIDSD